MDEWLLKIIVCPACKGQLRVNKEDRRVVEGRLICDACAKTYPIRDGIPRFVRDDDYCGNFGHQWMLFSATQIDAFSGSTESQHRFEGETAWNPEVLSNKFVLDAGCGSGRFTDVALKSPPVSWARI